MVMAMGIVTAMVVVQAMVSATAICLDQIKAHDLVQATNMAFVWGGAVTATAMVMAMV